MGYEVLSCKCIAGMEGDVAFGNDDHLMEKLQGPI
jgi:hypothetical protein